MSAFYRIASSAAGWSNQTSRLVALILVILLNLNLSMRLRAQQNDIKFECFSIEHGLSQNAVYSIIQDRQGFMWFATQSGLNRYDGYNFSVYNHDPFDSTSLSGVWIDDLFEDHFGNIWIATATQGLNMFDRETGEFTHYRHDPNDQSSLSHNELHAIFEDRSGTLWIGTEGGLDRFDRETGQFVHYKHDPNNPKSLSGNIVLSIFEDRSGTLWIGTAYEGLNKLVLSPDSFGKGYDGETVEFVHYKHDPDNPKSLGHNRVRSIYEDRSGTLWVGTRQGLNRLDREKNRFIRYYHDPANPKSLSHNTIWSSYVDSYGTLWIGTEGGLNKFDRAKSIFVRYKHDPLNPNSLSDSYVLSIYEDRSGTLWFGTFSGGVCKQNRNKAKFHHYKHDPTNPNSLSNNMVWSIFEDHSGILWIGTAVALDKFDRKAGEFTHYRHDSADPNSLSHDIVTSIYEDPDTAGRMLWVGTVGGLDKLVLSPDSFGKGSDTQAVKTIHYKHDSDNPASLTSSTIRSLYVDRSGNLWVGTFGGLNRLVLSPDSFGKEPDKRNEQFIRYLPDLSNPNSLSHHVVLAIYEDDSGTIWIGTEDGLNRFDREKEEFVQYKHDAADPRSLSNNVVSSIYQDPNSGTEDERILWVGTSKGLNKFYPEQGTFRHYFEKDGLPDDHIYGILGDDSGNLWVSTNRGLSKFNPQTEMFKNYDPSDGVQSLEFNEVAYHKSRSGELFFGGINGFNAFYPDSIKDNEIIPPIVLTDFRIFDKPAELDQSLNTIKEVDLSYKQNYFSFEFAALDYTTPEKNQYAYMLEGLDEDWIYSGTRRYASYTNVSGGEYVFRVKGSNSDGIWNEEGISVRVTITPPFWETWWFRTLLAASVVGVAFSGYKIRTKNIQARKEELEKEVDERTEQLQTARDELEHHRDELEHRVDERTKELARNREQYRQLAHRLLSVQDEERERLSRDIHDSLGQYLATLALQIGLIKKKAHSLTTEEVIGELDENDKLIREAIEECHRLSFELSPPSLRKLGFVHAINEVVTHFSELMGVKVIFKESLNGKRLTADQELMFFRILQESLNNIQKHASAKRVQVRLYEDGGTVHFDIEDDGTGFNMDEIDRAELHESMRGIGLVSMRERVSNLNGQFEIVTKIGEGTKVLVSVPLQKG